MKLEQLQEKVYPNRAELIGQEIPVTVKGQKGVMKVVKGQKGLDIFVGDQKVASDVNQARTLEDVLAYTNKMMKETGRDGIKLGH